MVENHQIVQSRMITSARSIDMYERFLFPCAANAWTVLAAGEQPNQCSAQWFFSN
jgi:hypothetical protein